MIVDLVRNDLGRVCDDLAHACVGFAAVHGGAPDDSPDFVRSASRWYAC